MTLAPVESQVTTAKFDLSLGYWQAADGRIEGSLEYAIALFDPATARRLLGHLEVLLGAALAQPDLPLGELPLLTAAEREQLRGWSAVSADPGGEALLHELFAAQAARAPEAVAVVFEETALTYGELDRRAAALARRLRELGVGPEVLVGLALERSAEMMVAILGTLMAGGAYVPLDPAWPEERVELVLEDSGARVLVRGEGAVLVVGEKDLKDCEDLKDCKDPKDIRSLSSLQSLQSFRSLSDHPAYVIYTSGSTGRPKGVVVTHRDAVRLFQATDEWFGFGPEDVWSLFHSYAFDFSVWEIWGALLYGGRLVVVPYWVSRSPEDFYRLLCRERVTVLNQTPSAFGQLMLAEEALGVSPELALRTVVFGGEALNLQSLAPWWSRHPEDFPRLVNMYGITETTVHVTYRPLSPSDLQGGSWIGRAIPDLSVHVLGPGFQPLPVGVPGELHVGGAGLARGYLSRPDLTAERFVPDPFSGLAGARLYRSGDLARWRATGELEYLGRIDHQVKIRGFRIELGEIEAALARHPAVREAVVMKGSGERLLAWLVVREEVETGELRRFLGELLPEHMIPGGWVLLDAFPLTPNGKVDRRALARIAPRAAERGIAEAPRTPVEQQLAGIWSDLLGVERVGAGDDFFALGGHSLLATRLVSRIRDGFGAELPLRALFEAPTLASMAGRIERAWSEGRSPEPPILHAHQERPPLSFSQERLWFIDQLDPGSAVYNIPVALRLRGPLDVAALAETVRELVRRHESLRTTFAQADGVPYQAIAPALEIPLPLWMPIMDLRGLPEPRRQAEAARLVEEEARSPFDLARGPLMRLRLARLEDEEWRLVLNLHHIISDGWSMGVLVRELGVLYEAFSQGLPSPLPELPGQYADFAVWQRQWLRGEVLEERVRFWREALAGAPELLEMPTDRPRPPIQSYRGGVEPVVLSPALGQAVRALAGREWATPFMVLMAVFQELLRRHSHQEDLLVGSPIANRNRAELEGLIGLFVNTLVLRRPAGLGAGATFRDLLDGVRQVSLEAYAHQDLPFEKLFDELGVERSLAHSVLFQAMFVLQNNAVEPLVLRGLELTPLDFTSGTSKFDLHLALMEVDGGGGIGGIEGTLDYVADLFDAATARRLVERFEILLAAAVADPAAPLASLPVTTAAEREQLRAWNATSFEYRGAEVCLHELIAAQTERTPGALAVLFEGESLSYRELDQRSGRLAAHLRGLGVGPEVLVGICAERSLEMVVGLLGILRAGGAYVPVDPGYPAERIAFMLEDAALPVLLTQSHLLGVLPEHGARLVLLDEDLPAASGAPVLEPVRVEPGHAAYAIFTSGSTGRPKGAVNTHRGIVNRLLWMQQAYDLTPEDRVLQKTPFSFDVSVWEFFWPLMTGARLIMARPGGHQDPAYLVETVAREGITTLHFVPSMLQVFVEQEGVERCASLRRVIASGEALPVALSNRFFDRLPGVELHNLYGPTEAAVDVTYHACLPGEDRVPIGLPVANTRIHLVDAEGLEVPVGVAGELCIGGVQVGRGYLRRPGLTADRFVPDPFGAPGARLYRTGDLARFLQNGEVEYLGRIDHQVKIRGFRIELGEIEAALARQPEVREAVVLARGEGADRALVAYLVPPVTDSTASGASLRESLRASLPEHMIPAAFVFLDAMPLSPNGKVDRKALSRIEPERAGGGSTAPRTPVEALLAAIWSDLLGVEAVAVEDHFFHLGGHSLMATRLISRLRDAFGVELPLRVPFEAPTLGELAARIESARLGGDRPVPPLRPAPRLEDPPLSFPQERLWFLDQLDPGSPLYNIPAALRLSGELDRFALERSFQEVVRRHETLRTTFPTRDGRPVQRIAPALDLLLPEVDLSALAAETRGAELRRLAAAEAVRPFDLWAGPLLRVLTLRLGAREHACLFTIHHIVGDAWSLDVVVREVGTLYAAFLLGESSSLPELPLQYGDFAVWQREWLQGETLEAELAWWRQELAGAPTVLDLPSDRPRPAARTSRGEALPVALPAAGLLHAVCRREGVTPFMALLASFQALLHRMTGLEDLLVGTPIAGRARTELEGLIGFFVNTLPLRGRPAGHATFRERLAEARATALGAFAHPDIPLERLVEDLGVERSLAYPPLVQVAFALQNAPGGAVELPGLTIAPIDLAGSTAKFDLTLSLFEAGGRLGGGLEYSADLFDRATMQRLLGHFGVLLDAALGDPGRTLADLPVLEESARHQILAEWNDYRSAFPERGVPELFEEQADLRPEAVAAVFGEESLTYAELDRHANRLANFLSSLGVGLGTPVAIYLERSLEMVVSTLAVLKAGGAYVPLDTSYPEERLAFMLEDVGAPVLITREEWLGLFAGARVEAVCVDRYAPVLARMSAERPRMEIPAQALAYVIYTSGSTGRPKGVAVPHRAIVRLVRDTNYVALGPDDVIAQASNTSFDAATFEIWGALLNGGRLVGVTKETMLSPADLAAQIRREGIGVLFLTTALFNQVAREAPEAFAPLQWVLFGGELVDPARVRSLLHSGPPERLLHVYGPTESTTYASWHLVDAVPEGAVTVPIGQPLGNTTLLVLDRSLRPVPPGWSGELYVGGDGLAWGYAHRPELTAERFVPDPFAEHGERLYRTGDLVRRRADGAIEFLGRADFQVKIRGFRIELGEVESALVALPGVRDAAVLVTGEGSEKRLVAYVAMPSPSGPDQLPDLRGALAGRLPSFMIPSAIVVLDALPLNPNGKVDRKALARIEPPAAEEREAGYVAPRTPAEELLAGIWSELLAVGRVGAEDSFFDLGGHSLLATRLVSLVRERFAVELPLRTVFEAPSLAGMALAVEQAQGGMEAPPIVPLSPVQRGERPHLSFAQERLWFLDRMEPGGALYSMPGAVRLNGRLDIAALERALREIVHRHEALRTTFDQREGTPFQVVAPEMRLPLPLLDLTALPRAEREAETLRHLWIEAARPFDLAQGPLLRVLLLRLDSDQWGLLFNFHHIVSDGWSVEVFIRELAALYGAFHEGQPSPLPPLPVQYADYAVWQRRWLTDDVLETQIAYWKEALAGAPPVLELPTDRPRPAVQTFRGATRPLAFSAGLSAELRALSRRQGGTLFMTLLAGYQALLHRYSGQGEVLVGSPIANRGQREIEGLIGLFVNAVTLRGRMSDEPSFRELAGRVRTAALGAYAHQDLPFERLVEELQIERSLARTPLYQVVFAMQGTHEAVRTAGGPEMAGLTIEPLAVDSGTAKLDLLLSLIDSGTVIEGAWEYSTDLFEPATVDRLSGHLQRLLAAAAADPERSVAELPLLTREESAQLLTEWNDTRRPFAQACLHELFDGWVARIPQAVAVRFEGEGLTYRELDARATRLARRLRALGVGPERLVGICADEGIERLVAVIAVFRAGGAYLPLDPAHPAERLAFMMEDAGIAVLLAEAHLLSALSETRASVVVLGDEGDTPEAAAAAGNLGDLEAGVLPENLAYVIYTSGSTGRPNGVMVRHRSAVNLIQNAIRQFHVEPGSRVLQSVSFSFDASVLETWMALASGSTLCIGNRESRLSGEVLAGLMRREEVTHAVVTPPNLAMLPVDGLPALRVVSVGGDRCPAELASRWAPPSSGLLRLMNCYGPTETTIYATAASCRGEYRREPPIGQPVANLQAYVLDAWGQLVPVGVSGELYMGGEGLARGYLARPGLTAERFIPDPFGLEPGMRLYRTGDLVRRLPEGDLEFLGRVDGQVKIRGLRIETGEVEAALGSHEAVAECAVLVRSRPGGEPALVACVVPSGWRERRKRRAQT